jgi:hypothetical protein
MYKCKQNCVFQDAEKTLHTFEKGKTYSKAEVAVVPKDVFKGDTPYFVETEDVEETPEKTTTKTTKKSKDEDTPEDGRV